MALQVKSNSFCRDGDCMLGMSEKEMTNWLDLIFGRAKIKKSALYSTGFTVIQDAIKTCSVAITSIMNYGHNT